jgi:outer membrane lipoprotein carrier protein
MIPNLLLYPIRPFGLLLLTFFSINLVFAQNDPKAKPVLDAVSTTHKKYPSIHAKFTLTTEVPDKKPLKESGEVYIKGEKYKLLMSGQEVVCNQVALWRYMADMNEVQISDYSPRDGEITPSSLFTIYQSDFYAMLGASERLGNVLHRVIDLTPIDKSRPYFKVRIWIDATNHIKQMRIFDKNGIRYTYEVTMFNPKIGLTDGFFNFDTKKYPGIIIEDLRL